MGEKGRDIPPEDTIGLHQLRISYKELRYSIELLADALPLDARAMLDPAVVFQKRLGEIHDADVAIEVIRVFDFRKVGREERDPFQFLGRCPIRAVTDDELRPSGNEDLVERTRDKQVWRLILDVAYVIDHHDVVVVEDDEFDVLCRVRVRNVRGYPAMNPAPQVPVLI